MRPTTKDGRTNQVRCWAFRATALSIGNSAATTIPLTSLGALGGGGNFGDSAGLLNPSSGDISIPISGWWRVWGSVGWSPNANGLRKCIIQGTMMGFGADVIVSNTTAGTNAGAADIAVSAAENELWLPAGSRVQLQGFQDTGGSLNVDSTKQTTFLGVRLLQATT